jgi:hypothetical protein
MKTLFSLTLLAALTGPIYAVDGVILINQSNALAGNVTPGDAPGFPVSITVSGSYRLSSNLILPDANTDGIDVSANNVTIDLNGFSIIGPVVCPGGPNFCSPRGNGVGITSSNIRNIVVLNGDIRGMSVGIALPGSYNRVEKIHVSENTLAGISLGFNSKVSSCLVNLNGGPGINVGPGSTISENVVSGNVGIGMIGNCISLIEGNTVTDNGGNISAMGPGCVLVNNAAP